MSTMATTSAPDLQNYFNGAWQRSSATEFVDVTNPATTEILARTPLSTTADVEAVVKAAADAFPGWRRVPAGDPPPWSWATPLRPVAVGKHSGTSAISRYHSGITYQFWIWEDARGFAGEQAG